MKTKLLLQTTTAFLVLIASLAASAQPVPRIDPTTGMPVQAGRPTPVVNPAIGLPAPPAASAPIFPAAIDPATGQLIPQPEPQWIDPSWTDPGIVLTNVSYDGMPLSEVARDLRERFKNYFDILPMPRTFDRDWGSEIAVQLQLKNVKASEVFNAMNMVFENDRTPVRWELKLNGNRPVVLLSVLPNAVPQPEPPQPRPAETRRMVIYVGNLIGDEKSGGMTMDQIIKTIREVWPDEFGKPEDIIRFHQDAQLLVVKGTRDQIDFLQQILAALRQKTGAVIVGRPQFPRGTGGVGSGGFGGSRGVSQPTSDQKPNSVGDQ